MEDEGMIKRRNSYEAFTFCRSFSFSFAIDRSIPSLSNSRRRTASPARVFNFFLRAKRRNRSNTLSRPWVALVSYPSSPSTTPKPIWSMRVLLPSLQPAAFAPAKIDCMCSACGRNEVREWSPTSKWSTHLTRIDHVDDPISLFFL